MLTKKQSNDLLEELKKLKENKLNGDILEIQRFLNGELIDKIITVLENDYGYKLTRQAEYDTWLIATQMGENGLLNNQIFRRLGDNRCRIFGHRGERRFDEFAREYPVYSDTIPDMPPM